MTTLQKRSKTGNYHNYPC